MKRTAAHLQRFLGHLPEAIRECLLAHIEKEFTEPGRFLEITAACDSQSELPPRLPQ